MCPNRSTDVGYIRANLERVILGPNSGRAQSDGQQRRKGIETRVLGILSLSDVPTGRAQHSAGGSAEVIHVGICRDATAAAPMQQVPDL